MVQEELINIYNFIIGDLLEDNVVVKKSLDGDIIFHQRGKTTIAPKWLQELMWVPNNFTVGVLTVLELQDMIKLLKDMLFMKRTDKEFGKVFIFLQKAYLEPDKLAINVKCLERYTNLTDSSRVVVPLRLSFITYAKRGFGVKSYLNFKILYFMSKEIYQLLKNVR